MTTPMIQDTEKGAPGRLVSLTRKAILATKTGATPDGNRQTTPSSAEAARDVGVHPDRHPGFVYLASLGSGSRRTMRQALDTVAGIVSGGVLDTETMDWARLRYQHTQAVRSVLAERYAPSTACKMLAALREC